MTLRAHYDTVCWQLNDPKTGYPPEYDGGDGWAHYRTAEIAAAALAERSAEHERDQTYELVGRPFLPLVLLVAQSFPRPCLGLFCDGHPGGVDEPIDISGEGWTHLDPEDPTPMDLADMEITTIGDKHYCSLDCTPPVGDDE